MKQNMIKTILIASVLTLSGAVLPASAADGLRVSVPFSFMVGNAKMDAGQYTVTQSDNGMVTFSGNKTSAMVLTVPADYVKGSNNGLSFTSTNNNPVLTGIKVSGAVSREIPLHNGVDRKTTLASAR